MNPRDHAALAWSQSDSSGLLVLVMRRSDTQTLSHREHLVLSRIGMTFVFGGCGEKLYQVTLSHSRAVCELV